MNEPDIIIPVNIDANFLSADDTIRDIREQFDAYGFRRYALCFPIGGWRSVGYPPREFFLEKAAEFCKIKKALSPFGIELGWCHCLTLKSGATKGFSRIVTAFGEEHAFANCPSDEVFRKRFSEDTALFCKLAKPAFVFFEDDFSLAAAQGCYCEKHLAEFAKQHGKYYTRKELVLRAREKDAASVALSRAWRDFTGDTLAEFARAVREETDKESPEIPMGLWQNAGDFADGFCTEKVIRALAGERHTPFVRLAGADYAGMKSKEIPETLYKAQYCKEHMENFLAYAEADTYPHTRYFTSGKQITALLAAAFSNGFDGAVFHTMQQFDSPNEETAYGQSFLREKKRFGELFRKAKECKTRGVTIGYDPFWNNFAQNPDRPLWLASVSRFGIPYTTRNEGEEKVRFWDAVAAEHADDEEVKKALSETLFLDGRAAKVLAERGFCELLGVSVGEDAAEVGKNRYDLAARESFCDAFADSLVGRNMFAPWMYSPGGNGTSLALCPTNEKTVVVSKIFGMRHNFITNGMTYFENALGGKITVMGMTLEHNRSQSLFNYRRRQVLQNILKHACDAFCLVESAPNVVLIENAASEKSDFREMLTVINLGEDDLSEISLHFPPTLCDFADIELLELSGAWQKCDFVRKKDGAVIKRLLSCCDAAVLLIK